MPLGDECGRCAGLTKEIGVRLRQYSPPVPVFVFAPCAEVAGIVAGTPPTLAGAIGAGTEGVSLY